MWSCSDSSCSSASISASHAGVMGGNKRKNKNWRNMKKGGGCHREPPSSAALKQLLCHVFQQFGHWDHSQNSDGSPKKKNLSFDSATEYAANAHVKNGSCAVNVNVKTVSFNISTFPTSGQVLIDSNSIESPLFDDGTPYSAIGWSDIPILLNQLGIENEFNIWPIPGKLNGHTHWQ